MRQFDYKRGLSPKGFPVKQSAVDPPISQHADHYPSTTAHPSSSVHQLLLLLVYLPHSISCGPFLSEMPRLQLRSRPLGRLVTWIIDSDIDIGNDIGGFTTDSIIRTATTIPTPTSTLPSCPLPQPVSLYNQCHRACIAVISCHLAA